MDNVQPPEWLQALAETACGYIDGIPDTPPIACHYHSPNPGSWEVSIFAGRTEVVGGPDDGLTISTPLEIDLLHLLEIFDTTDSVRWQSGKCDDDDDLAAHVAISGTFDGYRVELRVLAEAPADYGCGRRFHWNDSRIIDLW